MKTRVEPHQSATRGYETHSVLIWDSLSSMASKLLVKKEKLWEQEQDLLKGLLAECVKSRWIKNFFLVWGWECISEQYAQDSSWIFGVELSVLLHHFTLDRF